MARYLVCTSCLCGLLGLGGTKLPGPRTGSLMDLCEAHPTPRGTHAMNEVEAEPEMVEQWRASERAAAREPVQCEIRDGKVVEVAKDPAFAALVAGVAGSLLGGPNGPGLGARLDEIEDAVRVARNVVFASKGLDLR